MIMTVLILLQIPHSFQLLEEFLHKAPHLEHTLDLHHLLFIAKNSLLTPLYESHPPHLCQHRPRTRRIHHQRILSKGNQKLLS